MLRSLLSTSTTVHPSRPDVKVHPHINRREILLSGVLTSTLLAQRPALAAVDAQLVGAYLPPAGVGDLVQYTPGRDKTPALRAGTINPDSRYSFALPPSFKELRISNTQNSNFCQPRCAEPWTEVVFEDPKVGKIQLLAVPLLKLTNAKEVKVEDLGKPDQLLPRIAPFITGTYWDEDTVESVSSKKQDDGLTYYQYEINMPDALIGPHTLTAVTTKGEVAYLFVCIANERQWGKSEKTLRGVLDTFRA